MDEALRCPALHAEIKAAYPALQAHAGAAGNQAVFRIIGEQFSVFPQPDRSEEEWGAFWRAYYEDLSDLPLEALEAGVREARRQPGSEFLAKPGPLRALALKHAEPIYKAAHRAKRIAESLPRHEPTPEDLETRRAAAAEVLRSLGIRTL